MMDVLITVEDRVMTPMGKGKVLEVDKDIDDNVTVRVIHDHVYASGVQREARDYTETYPLQDVQKID